MEKEIEEIFTRLYDNVTNGIEWDVAKNTMVELFQSQSKELQKQRLINLHRYDEIWDLKERIKELEDREKEMMENAYRSGYSDCAKEQTKI